MRKLAVVTVAGVLAGMIALSGAEAETLKEALTAAYLNNPTLNAQRAALRSTDEAVPQALSGWRPTVTASGEYGRTSLDSQSSLSNTDTTLNPLSLSLSLSQPLYRGGRTVAATESAEAQVRAGRADLHNVEQTILQQAVTAYMDVLRDMAVVRLNENNVAVLKRQLEAANDRFKVGEITRTDVAQAEARLSRARSDLIQAQGNLISSKATYERVMGRKPGDLQPPPPLPNLPKSEDEALSVAEKNNPVLIAARERELASKKDIRAASGQLLPTVSLEGAVSYSEDSSTRSSETTSASIKARISVPLYQSGAVYSQVRQSREVNSQRKIQIDEAMRQVRAQVIQAWEALTTARSRIKANKKQVQANRIALEGVQQEALVGSRTTLDVLDAEQELLDSQVALVRAERDEYVAAYSLQSAIGLLTARNIGLNVDYYDPEQHYRQVRDQWIGTGGGLD